MKQKPALDYIMSIWMGSFARYETEQCEKWFKNGILFSYVYMLLSVRNAKDLIHLRGI